MQQSQSFATANGYYLDCVAGRTNSFRAPEGPGNKPEILKIFDLVDAVGNRRAIDASDCLGLSPDARRTRAAPNVCVSSNRRPADNRCGNIRVSRDRVLDGRLRLDCRSTHTWRVRHWSDDGRRRLAIAIQFVWLWGHCKTDGITGDRAGNRVTGP